VLVRHDDGRESAEVFDAWTRHCNRHGDSKDMHSTRSQYLVIHEKESSNAIDWLGSRVADTPLLATDRYCA
jgi:hypothetical protein